MAVDFFFQIHYCKGQKLKGPGKVTHGLTRTLQHHVMILAVEADGHITIGGTRYPIQSGMLFYIPPGVEQTIEPRAQSPEHYLTAHFSVSRVKLNSEGNWELQENIRALKQPSAQKITDYEPFEELFEKMLNTWDSKGPEYEFITGTYLRQLLIGLSQNNKNQNKSYAISLKVDQLIDYMRRNINRTITLDQLSGISGLSRFYLSKAFKEITGYPVIAYFNKMKIDKAKELIVEGNKKVKEVAYELGYANEFYFSRTFKRIEGISPSEFYTKNVYDF